MRRIRTDIVFPIHIAPLRNQVLFFSDSGELLQMRDASATDSDAEYFPGALVPGFVNAHCHLELSHTKGLFPEKQGLGAFLLAVARQRAADAGEIESAMEAAEKEMIAEGIAAVGDIANTSASFAHKSKRNLYYHTFIELLDLNPASARDTLAKGRQLMDQARNAGIRASLSPHAPYTASPALLELISKYDSERALPLSFHMLESNDENEFYVQGTGMIRRLYAELGLSPDYFVPSGTSSLETLLPYIHRGVRTQLVHNTVATPWDIEWAEEVHPNLYWCLCPRANLYIESRMPDVPEFVKTVQYITIGTDSLASNHSLSILAELMAIQTHFPEIDTADLLRWATLYGARFLGIDEKYGSMEPGKTPGLNCIFPFDIEAQMFLPSSRIQRIL